METNFSSSTGKGLTENLVRFVHLLRTHDVRVPFSSILDVLNSLKHIDISRIDQFRDALQCRLISTKNDLDVFDGLFTPFWIGDESVMPVDMYPSGCGFPEEPAMSFPPFPDRESTVQGNDAEKAVEIQPVQYSPLHLEMETDTLPVSFTESSEIYQQIVNLANRFPTRSRRRYKHAHRGHRIAFRKLLRKNLQFGGEPVFLEYKRKRIQQRRLIFFCDVSGSMDMHTLMILQYVHALKRVDNRAEIFFFSTDLTRMPREFEKRRFPDAFYCLARSVTGWGGGTRIGFSLNRFNRKYGDRWRMHHDIIMIFSDGWDRGEIRLLEDQMALLKRRAYKIIWLNPLMGTRDFQPICAGMRAALPYCDELLPAAGLEDLKIIDNKACL